MLSMTAILVGVCAAFALGAEGRYSPTEAQRLDPITATVQAGVESDAPPAMQFMIWIGC